MGSLRVVNVEECDGNWLHWREGIKSGLEKISEEATIMALFIDCSGSVL